MMPTARVQAGIRTASWVSRYLATYLFAARLIVLWSANRLVSEWIAHTLLGLSIQRSDFGPEYLARLPHCPPDRE